MPDDPLTHLLLLVFRLNGLLLEHGDHLARPHDLTSARWQVLGALREEPRTVPQVARRMGLTRQAVQRTIDVLTDDGLVVPQVNLDHRTSSMFALSDRGRHALAAVNQAQARWIRQISRQLSPSQRTVVGPAVTLLTALVDALEANRAR